MFISFCSTGYQAKPKDLLMADFRNLKHHNNSNSSLSVLSSYSSPALFTKRNSSLFNNNNKRNSTIEIKRHSFVKRELKRSFSDDNVNNSFQLDEKKRVVSSIYIQ